MGTVHCPLCQELQCSIQDAQFAAQLLQDNMQRVHHHEPRLCWQIRAARQPEGIVQDCGYDGS